MRSCKSSTLSPDNGYNLTSWVEGAVKMRLFAPAPDLIVVLSATTRAGCDFVFVIIDSSVGMESKRMFLKSIQLAYKSNSP